MFPCEMARYIAGFSREARKSGRCAACRQTSAGPSAHESGGEKANLFGLASARCELRVFREFYVLGSAQYAALLRTSRAAGLGNALQGPLTVVKARSGRLQGRILQACNGGLAGAPSGGQTSL